MRQPFRFLTVAGYDLSASFNISGINSHAPFVSFDPSADGVSYASVFHSLAVAVLVDPRLLVAQIYHGSDGNRTDMALFRDARLTLRASKRLGAFKRARGQGMSVADARTYSDRMYPPTAEDLAFEKRTSASQVFPWVSATKTGRRETIEVMRTRQVTGHQVINGKRVTVQRRRMPFALSNG